MDKLDRKFYFAFVCLLLVLLASCGGDEGSPPAQIALEPTDTPPVRAAATETDAPAPIAEPTAEPSPTRTAVPTPTATPMPTATPTAEPTPTPTPRPTNTPTATPVPSPEVRVTGSSVNVRGGPGTDYPVVGVLKEGDVVPVIAANGDGSWYNVTLPEGVPGWVAAGLLEPVNEEAMDAVAVAATIPAPPPTAVPTAPPPAAEPTSGPAPAPAGHGTLVVVNQTPNRVIMVTLWTCCETFNIEVAIGATETRVLPVGDYGRKVQSGNCGRGLPNLLLGNEIQYMFIVPTEGQCDWMVYLSSSE